MLTVSSLYHGSGHWPYGHWCYPISLCFGRCGVCTKRSSITIESTSVSGRQQCYFRCGTIFFVLRFRVRFSRTHTRATNIALSIIFRAVNEIDHRVTGAVIAQSAQFVCVKVCVGAHTPYCSDQLTHTHMLDVLCFPIIRTTSAVAAAADDDDVPTCCQQSSFSIEFAPNKCNIFVCDCESVYLYVQRIFSLVGDRL